MEDDIFYTETKLKKLSPTKPEPFNITQPAPRKILMPEPVGKFIEINLSYICYKVILYLKATWARDGKVQKRKGQI